MGISSRHAAIVVSVAGILFAIAPAALCQGPGNQASGAILGQVRLQSGLAAPAGIVVQLESRESGTLAETVSDTSGRFQFAALQPGEYVASLNSSDYQTSSQTVEVPSATSVPVELDVQPINKTADNNLPPGTDPTISVSQLSIPEKARKEYSKGLELLNGKHKPAKSISHFQRALQQYPQFAGAALFLGIAQLQVHAWGEAQTDLQRALRLDSHLTPAYLALGALFTEEGRFDQAQPLLSRALVLEPRSAMIHYELGRACWGLRRWKEAQEHARTALNLQPDLPEAHVLMGNILLRQGQANPALSQFRDYLRLAPDGPMAAPAKQVIARIEQHSELPAAAGPIAAGARPR